MIPYFFFITQENGSIIEINSKSNVHSKFPETVQYEQYYWALQYPGDK